MSQGGQVQAPSKNKGKGGMSTQTMISAGIGGAVVVEAVVLALLWKKVNEIGARNDPNTNDNKYIAQYIALKDKEHETALKDLTDRLKILETEQKKQVNVPAPVVAAADAGAIKKINANYAALLQHVNELTAAFNDLETTVAQLKKNPVQQQKQQQQPKKVKSQQQQQQQSDDSFSDFSDDPKSPVRNTVPRKATNIAPPTKRATNTSTRTAAAATGKQTQKPATNKKKIVLETKVGNSRPTDEMPSDIDTD